MYIYIDLSVFYCLAGLSSRVDPARKKPSRRTGKTEAEKTGRKKADCVGAGVCAAYKKKKEKT